MELLVKLIQQLLKINNNTQKKGLKLESPTQKCGEYFELQAIELLQKKGFKLIARNFQCKLGEIDVIMQDSSTLVFVEVRYRKDSYHGSAEESITPSKQKKLIKTTEFFCLQNPQFQSLSKRIDVVAFNPPKVNIIHNAVVQ